jgi:hypothetical protein
MYLKYRHGVFVLILAFQIVILRIRNCKKIIACACNKTGNTHPELFLVCYGLTFSITRVRLTCYLTMNPRFYVVNYRGSTVLPNKGHLFKPNCIIFVWRFLGHANSTHF